MQKPVRIGLYSLLGICIVLVGVAFYYYVPDIPVEELNRKYSIRPENYMRLNGMNVHYRQEGPPSDTVPVVLLHGTGSSLFTWNGWTHLLQDSHRIIRLDLPGFGLTGPHPAGDYTLEIYIEFIHAFLARLGIKQCILAGNSIGGEIAWRYALHYPSQVNKLILIAAAGYPIGVQKLPPISYILLRLPIIRDLVAKATPPSVIRNSLAFLYANPDKITQQLVELYFDMTCREGNRQALTERMESIARTSPWKQIPAITIPTLILWGEKDQLIPVAHAKRFHKDLPNSRLVIFPDAGHMPMEEIPQKTALAAKEFITNATPAVY